MYMEINNIDIKRLLIIGNSTIHKTKYLLQMLQNKVEYSIFIITDDMQDPCFQLMQKENSNSVISSDLDILPKIDETHEKCVVVFDSNIVVPIDYYIRSRSHGIDIICLAHEYADLPMMIRRNAFNVLLLEISIFKDRYFLTDQYPRYAVDLWVFNNEEHILLC